MSMSGGKVPVDGLTIEERQEGVHPVLFWFVFSLSILGVLMAICFLIFNVYNRNVRYRTSDLNIVYGCRGRVPSPRGGGD